MFIHPSRQCEGIITCIALLIATLHAPPVHAQAPLYEVNNTLRSYAISFENPTGEKGKGGKAASPLGVGRKGSPARMLMGGDSVQLCDIEGMGTIRHIWMTTLDTPLANFRNIVVRVYWDGQEHPSIEAPPGRPHGLCPW